MTRPTPSLEAIIAAFETEIARAPRWAQVDRDLLQRLIDDHRRLPPRTPQEWVDAHRKFARKDVRDKQTLIAQIDTLCDEIDRLNHGISHSQRESQGWVVGA